LPSLSLLGPELALFGFLATGAPDSESLLSRALEAERFIPGLGIAAVMERIMPKAQRSQAKIGEQDWFVQWEAGMRRVARRITI